MLRLCIEGVSYARQTQPLFHELNAEIHAGQLLLLEGANGVGKTTLLKLIAGLLEPTQGRICLQSTQGVLNPPFADQQAWLGHRNALKAQLSPVENLRYLYPHGGQDEARLIQALDYFALFEYRHRPLLSFSQGMQRRVALAGLMLSSARLWLLDEPQASLDAQGVALFEAMLMRHLERDGLAVVASHHALALPKARVQRWRLADVC